MTIAYRKVIPAGAALALFLALPFAASETLAHRAGRPHRHPHRARYVVRVGTAVALARPIVINGVAHGTIDFDVDPPTTEVRVDGARRGQVDDFDGHPKKLILRAGTHRITLVTPDGESLTRKVKIVAGHEINLKLDLEEASD